MTPLQRLLMVITMTVSLAPLRALAQQPDPTSTVTLTGVVLEAGTSTPVSGAFLSLGTSGPRAIADSLGRFRMLGAPLGPQQLLVRRFGYRDLTTTVDVSRTPAALELRMEPDAVQLEGVTVTTVTVDLTGRVVNAESSAPVPWALLWLSRDAVQRSGRANADLQGLFNIDDVATGPYFLRAEALGYEAQIVLVDVLAPPEPVEIRLRPDSLVMARMPVIERDLRSRRNYASGVNRTYDATRLNYSAAPSAVDFLQWESFVVVVSCEAGSTTNLCIVGRGGRVVQPRVYIDELPIQGGLDVLQSYAPGEFHAIEVFSCGAIRAYTPAYFTRQARRPRQILITDC
jgi:hypothetical protein